MLEKIPLGVVLLRLFIPLDFAQRPEGCIRAIVVQVICDGLVTSEPTIKTAIAFYAFVCH